MSAETRSSADAFRGVDRPQAALITNHGYGGVTIPIGGAPDTGGQNLFVNSMAVALDEAGYRVTIFARGGFPNFEDRRMRSEPEYLSENVRYVFVPGGGSHFIRKEDIAIALDEELEWLDDFVRREANQRGCEPWDLYDFINTHYWDAAVLGSRLVERWQNDVVAQTLRGLLVGLLPPEAVEQLWSQRHWMSFAETPHYHVGRLLLRGEWAEPIEDRARRGAEAWAREHELGAEGAETLVGAVDQALTWAKDRYPPALRPMVAYDAIGTAALDAVPGVVERMLGQLTRTDRHVWTPHSLGDLKDWNFRRRPLDVRQDLRFCERRSHERMVTTKTRAFAATSSDIAEMLHTHYGVPMEQIYYFPPCIDTERFRVYTDSEVASTYAYLSEVSGVPVEKLQAGRILFETSRMDGTKRKDLVLSGFARVVKQVPDSYLFIGGGPVNDLFVHLQQQIEFTDALHGRAWLTKPIPDEHMGPLFSIADVYVSASEMEGFGMAVAQASAAGTLVVSADTIPFSVHHAPDACVLFRSGDVRELARALYGALTDEKERRARTKVLMERVHRHLNWNEKTEGFLRFLSQRGVAPGPGTA